MGFCPPCGPLDSIPKVPADWVWRQRTVESFMGRRGDVCLTMADIVWAGGAPSFSPVLINPSSPWSPPEGDSSLLLATTEWVTTNVNEWIEKAIQDLVIEAAQMHVDHITIDGLGTVADPLHVARLDEGVY